MLKVLHRFITGKADGPDSTRVRPSAWNDEHDITVEEDGVVLGREAGLGPGPVGLISMAALLPAGTVLPFAGATIPSGFLLCNGASYERVARPALYTAIGTAFGPGAVPGSTFQVPNLQGRSIFGLDPSGLILSNVTMTPNGNTIGASGGQQTVQYAVTGSLSGVAVTNGLGGTAFTNGLGTDISNVNRSRGDQGGGWNMAEAGHWHTVQGNASIQVSGNAALSGSISGGVTDVRSNMPPALLMNWIIRG